MTRPHIILVVPRGEAVRNFLYSDTLACLSQECRVTLLSVLDDEQFLARFRPFCERIIPLRYHRERRALAYLRLLTDTAHDRWLWSAVARNRWAIRQREAAVMGRGARLKRRALAGLATVLARRRVLEGLTALEQRASWALRPTDEFRALFEKLEPDLVFNCSHIHGPAGELPLKVAHRMGIPTAGFIFSWDNLMSRSRIFVPYDYYLVWNERMRRQLLDIYPAVRPDRVLITGTPQFDFHFQPAFWLDRPELCQRIGADPDRPFVLYTTGIDKHFPEEHHHVRLVAELLAQLDIAPKPQLVVRMYVKGTSAAMKRMATTGLPNAVFPPVLWEERWHTPMYADLAVYTSLLRHAALGINAASTVSLELLMHDKPTINLGFDPPGTALPEVFRFERHINFDHFRPVVASGATMVARSADDMRAMLHRGLTQPDGQRPQRTRFIAEMFDGTLDGRSGTRVAQQLVALMGAA